MTVALHIEPLKEDEIGELLTLQRAAFLRDAQLYANPFLPSLTQTMEQIQAHLADPSRTFLVAKRGARLVGSVRAIRKGRCAYISRLMTAPDLQGQGIGGALLSAIEARMSADVDTFMLSTGLKSTANIAMYERHGYARESESVDDAGISIIVMTKATPYRAAE